MISDEQFAAEADVTASAAASVTLASAVAALGSGGGPEDIYQRLQMFISSCSTDTAAAAAAAHGANTDSLTALQCVQPNTTVKHSKPS